MRMSSRPTSTGGGKLTSAWRSSHEASGSGSESGVGVGEAAAGAAAPSGAVKSSVFCCRTPGRMSSGTCIVARSSSWITLAEMTPRECIERQSEPPLESRIVLPVTREAPPRPMAMPAIWLAKISLSLTRPCPFSQTRTPESRPSWMRLERTRGSPSLRIATPARRFAKMSFASTRPRPFSDTRTPESRPAWILLERTWGSAQERMATPARPLCEISLSSTTPLP
mmetsp:Transcript_32095/g.102288  ORF Transcript_32095/g.102288 Transcript_32095/m.102288 type:complete len:225 (-) Transcript_32095:877-1551(-)